MPVSEQDDILRELGRQLAERRAAENMTIEDVYDRTRIRMEFIRGIEEGNYSGFPETVYIKGFIRTYLKLVNAEDMLDDFMECFKRNQQQKLEQQRPVNFLGKSSFPKGFKPVSHFWLFLVLLAALGGTAGYVWYMLDSGSLTLKDLITGREQLIPHYDSSRDVSGAAASDDVSGDSAVSFEIIPSADLAEEPSPEPEKPASPYIELRANNDVWMRVTIGGKNVYEKVLAKGGVVSWDLTERARVVYGRPNAVTVVLNGKDIGTVNPKPTKKSEAYIYMPDGTFRRDN